MSTLGTLTLQTDSEEVDMHDDSAQFIQECLGCPYGFDFSGASRNALLLKSGAKLPKFTKTGTTIAGLIFADGVILGADTRATAGNIVAQKNCEKIHFIAPNIYCCGAGTAADTENVTEMISSQLTLMRLNTETQSRVVLALTRLKRYLFRYMGYVSAALVLGGVDIHGPHLHTIWPQGSTSTLPYVTMGSGSLAAMAVFEAHYRKGMTMEEGMELCQNAILSGISNDMGSGSNVDLCVMTRDETKFHRNIYKTVIPHAKDYEYKFRRGTTRILSRDTIEFGEEDSDLKQFHANFNVNNNNNNNEDQEMKDSN